MKEKKILIVISEYYKKISSNLTSDAINHLKKNKRFQSISTIIKVPGIFEIPVVIANNSKKYDGFIVLGCVIKGETPHFEYISQATINAIMTLSIQNKKPIGNGILTCLNKKQALHRSTKKGTEAASAVINMLS